MIDYIQQASTVHSYTGSTGGVGSQGHDGDIDTYQGAGSAGYDGGGSQAMYSRHTFISPVNLTDIKLWLSYYSASDGQYTPNHAYSYRVSYRTTPSTWIDITNVSSGNLGSGHTDVSRYLLDLPVNLTGVLALEFYVHASGSTGAWDCGAFIWEAQAWGFSNSGFTSII